MNIDAGNANALVYVGENSYGTMPVDWDGVELTDLRIRLVAIDEFGTPVDRRGNTYSLPTRTEDPAERAKVARMIGKAVERTARDLMGLPYLEEEAVIGSRV